MDHMNLPDGYSWHPKYLWRQDTPMQQLTVFWGSFQGNYLNLQEGLITQDNFNKYLEKSVPQITELMDMVRKNVSFEFYFPHED